MAGADAYCGVVITSKRLKTSSMRDASLLRGTVSRTLLLFEAIYFLCAAIFVTVFGLKVAQGSANDHGFIEATSLPLVAAGAFALWGLALMVVLRHTSNDGFTQSFRSRYRLAHAFVMFIGLCHIALGVSYFADRQVILGTAVVALGCLLGVCVYSQRQWKGRVLRISGSKRTTADSASYVSTPAS